MKTLTTALAALLCAISAAYSQSDWGSSAPLAVALTISWTGPGTVAKDEVGKALTGEDAGPAYSNSFSVDTVNRDGDVTKTVATEEFVSKVFSYKYTNAVIIRMLVEEGTLPEIGRAPFVAGWSLVRMCNAEGEPYYVARHTNKTWVGIDGIAFGFTEDPFVSASTTNQREVLTANFNLATGDSTEARLYTFNSSFKGLGSGNVFGFEDLRGLYSGTSKNVTKVERVAIDDGFGDISYETYSTDVLVSGALKLDRIVGYDGDPDLPGLVEGTITAGAATLQNIAVYLPEPDDF